MTLTRPLVFSDPLKSVSELPPGYTTPPAWWPESAQTADFSVALSGITYKMTGTTALTGTLVTSLANGTPYRIKNMTNKNCTVAPQSGQSIDGVVDSTIKLGTGSSVDLVAVTGGYVIV